jgi:hypothetical protein
LEEIRIPIRGGALAGDLELPPAARGLILLGRSPRDRLLAEVLKRRMGTLLVDLGPATLRCATEWAAERLRTQLGLLVPAGAAPPALEVAAQLPELVRAVVCRGGCAGSPPSLLAQVRASTLLLVGSDDVEALASAQSALGRLAGIRELAVLAGTGARFAEPGALGRVAELARGWFELYLDL